jgi:hypothetical protein
MTFRNHLWRCHRIGCDASFHLFTDLEEHELWEHGGRRWAIVGAWVAGLTLVLLVVVAAVR